MMESTIERNSSMSCLLGLSCTSVVKAWVGPGCTYKLVCQLYRTQYIKAWLKEFAINGEITEMCYLFTEATLHLWCKVAQSIACFCHPQIKLQGCGYFFCTIVDRSGVARILKLPGHRDFTLLKAVHRGVQRSAQRCVAQGLHAAEGSA